MRPALAPTLTQLCTLARGVLITASALGCVSRGNKVPSQLDIAGGRDIPPSTFPAVVEVKSEFTDSDTESCTATAIAPQIFLTAAHCVWHQIGQAPSLRQKKMSQSDVDVGSSFDDLLDARRKRQNPFRDDIEEARSKPGARSIVFKKADGQILSTSCFTIRSGWGLESGGPGSSFDVALLFFPQPAIDHALALYDGPRIKGSSVTLVGFGWKDAMGSDSFIKREGHNTIADIHAEGVIYTYATPGKGLQSEQRAMIRDGDSGGPLLLDGRIAGVASALLSQQNREICDNVQDTSKSCRQEVVDIGYHVDLTAPQVRRFIDDSLAAFREGQIDPRRPGETCTPRDKAAFIEKLKSEKMGS